MWRQIQSQPWLQKILNSKAFFMGKRLYERYIQDDVGGLAAESTYFWILALVPFLIFLFNVVLFFAASQLGMVLQLLTYLPPDARQSLEPIVMDIISSRSTTVLSVGLLLALWSSSKGITTLIQATDRAFGMDKNEQSYIRVKTKSVLFTLLLVGAMLGALAVLVFGNAIVHAVAAFFQVERHWLVLWDVFKFCIPFMAMVLSLSVFYRYAPAFVHHDASRTTWKETLISSAIVTGLWLLMTAGYGYYVGNIANMGATYGSLVGLMILFIWFNLSATIFIMGAEFIAVYSEMRQYVASRR